MFQFAHYIILCIYLRHASHAIKQINDIEDYGLLNPNGANNKIVNSYIITKEIIKALLFLLVFMPSFMGPPHHGTSNSANS